MYEQLATWTAPWHNHPVAIRSPRAAEVAAWFDIEDLETIDPRHWHAPALSDSSPPPTLDDAALPSLLASPGQIVLINGPSGAGKSSLLRAMRSIGSTDRWIDLLDQPLPDTPIVDCFGSDTSLEDVLSLLSRVGLAEAWTYLRTPSELSDGQRWRLRLALSLHQARACIRRERTILVADEFAALLDRVSACVVAHALRRSIRPQSDCTGAIAPAPAAIVATSHDDLVEAMSPDIWITCDFGRIVVKRAVAVPATSPRWSPAPRPRRRRRSPRSMRSMRRSQRRQHSRHRSRPCSRPPRLSRSSAIRRPHRSPRSHRSHRSPRSSGPLPAASCARSIAS